MSRWWLLLFCLSLLAGLSSFFLTVRPALAATAPPGFTDSLVANVGSPTGLAFTPDGRLLVTSQPGKLRVVDENGELLASPALDLASKVCANSERGLLGVAVDPDFTTNDYIYLYYTTSENGGCVNRVARYTLSGNNEAAFDRVLVDNIPSQAGNHNAGDLHFGKDGYLYVSVGDGGCDYAGNSGCSGQNDAARDPHVLLGKILRVTRDGGVPETNPYRGADSARCNTTGRTTPGNKCQETFASGLRNPFRFAFDPNTQDTRFFINDVGQNAWEEIDEGRVGADYGWNLCEGRHDNPNRPGSVNCASPYTPPIHEYNHNTGCQSITGGAFVPDGVWPSEYEGSYLFGDYVCGTIFKLTPNGTGGYTRTNFVTGLGGASAVAMTFGPSLDGSQGLYYTTYSDGGQVRRIGYTDAPTAALTANPSSSDPLTYEFDGSESRDPNPSDTLTYLWDFGDGDTEETTTSTTSHTYSETGIYTASLRVRDSSGATSASDTVRIDPGNAVPTPEITAPDISKLFRVGEEITLSGRATDPEEGSLPDTALSWEVIRHHNDSHTHPFFSGTGNNLEFQAPPPEDLFATGEGNYLEIRLTATDSRGISRTVSQQLLPKTVDIGFATSPSGLRLNVNGATITAPETLTSWEGYELNVAAPPQRIGRAATYVFVSWSDGGAASHTITTPAEPTTYTATFRPVRRR